VVLAIHAVWSTVLPLQLYTLAQNNGGFLCVRNRQVSIVGAVAKYTWLRKAKCF